MTTIARHPAVLAYGPQITLARTVQQHARRAWRHSPNADTEAALQRATAALDHLLEQLHAAITR